MRSRILRSRSRDDGLQILLVDEHATLRDLEDRALQVFRRVLLMEDASDPGADQCERVLVRQARVARHPIGGLVIADIQQLARHQATLDPPFVRIAETLRIARRLQHELCGLGDLVGAAKMLAVLEAMHAFYQDPRYRPSPWLKRRAQLGVSLLTPE